MIVVPLRFLFCLVVFLVRIFRRCEWVLLIKPLPRNLKRFLAPLLVFIFGIFFSLLLFIKVLRHAYKPYHKYLLLFFYFFFFTYFISFSFSFSFSFWIFMWLKHHYHLPAFHFGKLLDNCIIQ